MYLFIILSSWILNFPPGNCIVVTILFIITNELVEALLSGPFGLLSFLVVVFFSDILKYFTVSFYFLTGTFRSDFLPPTYHYL